MCTATAAAAATSSAVCMYSIHSVYTFQCIHLCSVCAILVALSFCGHFAQAFLFDLLLSRQFDYGPLPYSCAGKLKTCFQIRHLMVNCFSIENCRILFRRMIITLGAIEACPISFDFIYLCFYKRFNSQWISAQSYVHRHQIDYIYCI